MRFGCFRGGRVLSRMPGGQAVDLGDVVRLSAKFHAGSGHDETVTPARGWILCEKRARRPCPIASRLPIESAAAFSLSMRFFALLHLKMLPSPTRIVPPISTFPCFATSSRSLRAVMMVSTHRWDRFVSSTSMKKQQDSPYYSYSQSCNMEISDEDVFIEFYWAASNSSRTSNCAASYL